MDLGEEETIEEIFEFLGSVKLPSFSLDNPEELTYMFDKNYIFGDDDPIFFAHLTYDEGASGDLLADTHLYISNHEDKSDYGEMLDTEQETLSNGVEVTIGKFDTEFITTLFEEDGIYYRFEVLSEDRDAASDNLIEVMEAMDEKNDLYEKMNNEMKKSVDEYFIMPPYFATNLDLNMVSIDEVGMSFSYKNSFTTDNGEDVGSQINYSLTNEWDSSFQDFEDEDITKEKELPSGREAHIKRRARKL